jgi:hypothetical protein
MDLLFDGIIWIYILNERINNYLGYDLMLCARGS